MVAGLDRQLARADLSAGLRARLASARTQLWSAIDAAGELRSSSSGRGRSPTAATARSPSNPRSADADESNAAQLWSTVFLALPKNATGTYSPSARPR